MHGRKGLRRGIAGICALCCLVLVFSFIFVGLLSARTGATIISINRLIFPNADRFVRRIRSDGRDPLNPDGILSFVAVRGAKRLGTVYYIRKIIRTKPAIYAVGVSAAGVVVAVKVVKFAEPPEYLPLQRYFDQFRGSKLDRKENLEPKIDSVSGATLTSRATNSVLKKILMLDLHRNVQR